MLIYWFPYILTTPFLREEENMGPRASDFSTTSSIKTVNTTPHSFSLQNIAPFVTPINSPTQAIGHYIRFLHPSALVPYPETQRFPCSQTSDAKSSALVKRLAWSKELSVLKAKSSALKQRVKRLLAWSKEVGATWSKEVSVKQSGWRYMKQRGWREAKRLALHEAKRLAWSKDLGVKQRPRRWSKEVGQREAKRWTWSKEVSAKQTGCMAWMRQRTHSRVRKLWVPQTNFGIFMVYFQSFKFETVQSWVHDIRIECGITKLSSFRTQIGD